MSDAFLRRQADALFRTLSLPAPDPIALTNDDTETED